MFTSTSSITDNTLNQADQYSKTPLNYATNFNKVDAIELLLKVGAYIDAKDAEGQTALHNVVALAYDSTPLISGNLCCLDNLDIA